MAYPSTPYDAKGLLLSAIDDEDPCVFVECTSLMMKRGSVPEAPYKIPFGKAAIRKEGTDVTHHQLRPPHARRAEGGRPAGRSKGCRPR